MGSGICHHQLKSSSTGSTLCNLDDWVRHKTLMRLGCFYCVRQEEPCLHDCQEVMLSATSTPVNHFSLPCAQVHLGAAIPRVPLLPLSL